MHELIDTALEWYYQGIAPIPCYYGTKLPVITWRQYQSGLLPSESQVKKWFKGQYNLALVTGGKRNLTVLDFDKIPLYWKWKKYNPELSNTFTVTTPRPGKHVYFFLDESCGTKIKLTDGVDVKASRGIVVVPPSVIKKHYKVAINKPILRAENLDALLSGIDVIKPKSDSYIPLYRVEKYDDSDNDVVAQILNKISILGLANQYTKMTSTDPAGRWWMGICPVHNDKNPSFRVDATYNKCGCFSQSCRLHNGGDVIDLYAAIKNISITNAIGELSKLI